MPLMRIGFIFPDFPDYANGSNSSSLMFERLGRAGVLWKVSNGFQWFLMVSNDFGPNDRRAERKDAVAQCN